MRTFEEIELFRRWHEERLMELAYSQKIAAELRSDREKWLQPCIAVAWKTRREKETLPAHLYHHFTSPSR